ncbi:hypothetical protein [Marihabitans asiaticum]|uniref:hypothetical protein n=1 Tax=Marihabitans asiaticum TaxID=415218 RepID=UPI0014795E4A|nr:hypothetical protein [Marihabitans asiaticum]
MRQITRTTAARLRRSRTTRRERQAARGHQPGLPRRAESPSQSMPTLLGLR